jgi:hypothetical protein
LILCLNGNPDVSVTVGMEPQSRPKNLAEGEFKIYEKWNGFLYAKQDKWEITVGSATIKMERDSGKIYIN